MTIIDDTRTVESDFRGGGAYPLHDRNAPFFGPRDFIAGIVIAAMIWGPLVAGVITHS